MTKSRKPKSAGDKPTIPAAVAEGRAPQIDPRAAEARDRALAAAGAPPVPAIDPDPQDPPPYPDGVTDDPPSTDGDATSPPPPSTDGATDQKDA